jgi:hypothetical protein
MRVVAARLHENAGKQKYYHVELTDGRNVFYLDDVAYFAGPIEVDSIVIVNITPAMVCAG